MAIINELITVYNKWTKNLYILVCATTLKVITY